MSQWTGRLEHIDLGPGRWVLHTDQGEQLELAGEIPRALVGQRVRVEGRKASALGIGMLGGGAVDVTTIERA